MFWFVDLMSNFIQNNIDKQHSMQQQYWDQMVKQNQQLQQQQQHHGATSSRVEYKNIFVQKLRIRKIYSSFTLSLQDKCPLLKHIFPKCCDLD